MWSRRAARGNNCSLTLENYDNDEVKRTIQALRSVKVENDAWYPQPDPSLDLMRCLVDVDGGAHWPVLLSKPGSSVFAEPVHYASIFVVGALRFASDRERRPRARRCCSIEARRLRRGGPKSEKAAHAGATRSVV